MHYWKLINRRKVIARSLIRIQYRYDHVRDVGMYVGGIGKRGLLIDRVVVHVIIKLLPYVVY